MELERHTKSKDVLTYSVCCL